MLLLQFGPHSILGFSFSFLFGADFLGTRFVVHTPPERGFINREVDTRLLQYKTVSANNTSAT